MARRLTALALLLLLAGVGLADEAGGHRVLFIGNSFTQRNRLSEVVRALAVEGQPDQPFEITTLVYGGQTLKQHWELHHSYNFLRLPKLTRADLEQEIAILEQARAAEQNETNAGRLAGAIANHRRSTWWSCNPGAISKASSSRPTPNTPASSPPRSATRAAGRCCTSPPRRPSTRSH